MPFFRQAKKNAVAKELKEQSDGLQQRIRSMEKHLADHEGLLQLAIDKQELVNKELEKEEAKHNQTVKDALAKVNKVDEDWEAKVDAAKAAKDKAEAELSELENIHGGEAEVTSVSERMVREAEAAAERSSRELATASKVKAAVHSFQTGLDDFYAKLLTKTENVFHRKLLPVLKAPDATEAKANSTGRMEQVDEKEVIQLGKDIYLALGDLKTTGGVIIKDNADLSATISDGLAKVSATTDEMMVPVCNWYAITHGVDEPDASACDLFKSKEMEK